MQFCFESDRMIPSEERRRCHDEKMGCRLGTLAVCACPDVFWGMYGDAAWGSMAGDLPLLARIALLGWRAARTRDVPTLLAQGMLF